MKQLFFGLCGEGNTDLRFFKVLLERCIEKIFTESDEELSILEPLTIKKRSGNFIEQMKNIENEHSGLNVIFVHMDADDRNQRAVLETKWNPWLEVCTNKDLWVPVIPIKMLESWMLADTNALSRVFILSEKVIIEITENKPVESIINPKEKLT